MFFRWPMRSNSTPRGQQALLVLITNNTLDNRAGTELYVRDLALGLLNRGHTPIAYSSRLGEVARELRANGVQVVDDLELVPFQPDIIHGHHHLDTMTALLRFPGTPAIFVCHGSTPWEEAAPRFPRILRYVAVDHACRDRLVLQHAIPPDRIRVILNFVDLERFKPRAQLPPRPRRALIFSNQANENTHVPAVRTACERVEIQLDVVGLGVAKACATPEAVLGNYDIVFAKGRAALEALAVGSAVVLCDAAGAGPMVTTGNVEQLRPLNFGIRALCEPLSADVIAREVARYDTNDAMAVAGLIRVTAGLKEVIDDLIFLYREVIDEHHRTPNQDLVAEQNAVAVYLGEVAPRLRAGGMLEAKATQLEMITNQLEMITNSRSWRMISRYAAIKQKLLHPARRVLRGLSWPRAVTRRLEGESPPAQKIFGEIYRRKDWGNGESVSGSGSSVARTAVFRDEIGLLLSEIKAKSLLDAGCGDFNWMKEIELDLAQYIGIDVVPELIGKNQKAHGNDSRTFLSLDMTKDKLPQVDLILCRDSLVHFSFADILRTLENFSQSGSTYLLTTTFARLPRNVDICTGEWRQINLQMPPFDFPEPLKLIDEKCTHSGAVFDGKCLGFWALKDVWRS
jgi:glycosyltransferase involved in cell wall biosynthesis/2-polyprenyl-3-methyl-5-hydroxy-6-metoxy-1,4-benzoquinol methylase